MKKFYKKWRWRSLRNTLPVMNSLFICQDGYGGTCGGVFGGSLMVTFHNAEYGSPYWRWYTVASCAAIAIQKTTRGWLKVGLAKQKKKKEIQSSALLVRWWRKQLGLTFLNALIRKRGSYAALIQAMYRGYAGADLYCTFLP